MPATDTFLPTQISYVDKTFLQSLPMTRNTVHFFHFPGGKALKMSKVIELYKLTLLSFFPFFFFLNFALCQKRHILISFVTGLLQRVTYNKVLSLNHQNLHSGDIKQVYAKQKMAFWTELPPLKPESMTQNTSLATLVFILSNGMRLGPHSDFLWLGEVSSTTEVENCCLKLLRVKPQYGNTFFFGLQTRGTTSAGGGSTRLLLARKPARMEICWSSLLASTFTHSHVSYN